MKLFTIRQIVFLPAIPVRPDQKKDRLGAGLPDLMDQRTPGRIHLLCTGLFDGRNLTLFLMDDEIPLRRMQCIERLGRVEVISKSPAARGSHTGLDGMPTGPCQGGDHAGQIVIVCVAVPDKKHPHTGISVTWFPAVQIG